AARSLQLRHSHFNCTCNQLQQINTIQHTLKNPGDSAISYPHNTIHPPKSTRANAIELRCISRYIPHLSRIHPAFDPHLSPLINKGEYIGSICVYYPGKTEQAIADCTLSQYVQIEVWPGL